MTGRATNLSRRDLLAGGATFLGAAALAAAPLTGAFAQDSNKARTSPTTAPYQAEQIGTLDDAREFLLANPRGVAVTVWVGQDLQNELSDEEFISGFRSRLNKDPDAAPDSIVLVAPNYHELTTEVRLRHLAATERGVEPLLDGPPAMNFTDSLNALDAFKHDARITRETRAWMRRLLESARDKGSVEP